MRRLTSLYVGHAHFAFCLFKAGLWECVQLNINYHRDDAREFEIISVFEGIDSFFLTSFLIIDKA